MATAAKGPSKVDRRGFLGLLGAGALAACSSAGSGSSPITPTRVPSSPPPTSASAAPPNWAALRNKLSGTLVLPTDPTYAVSRQLYDFRYDSIQPQAIAYCESPSDVQTCLDVARASAITPRPRCGGHSYGGWSTGDGLVIDVTRMVEAKAPGASVEVSRSGQVRPMTDGKTTLTLSLGSIKSEVPVTIAGMNKTPRVDFVHDVNPVMSRLGCNSGTCHGSAQGKNGFKLSLRGYDPIFDVRALTDDQASRRVNVASPDDSYIVT